MKKKITDNYTLFYTDRFPFTNKKVSKKKNLIYIGIGGNVGDTKKVFHKLFDHLKHSSRFDIVKTAPILQNPPFGYMEQDDFFNSMIVLQSDLSPLQALKIFQRLEKRFKRVRSFKDAPRTLDIDIIFFNSLKKDSKNLTVPHPFYHERLSVLIPLEFVLSV